MKMHHLLNATALALILGVAPAAAQQSQTDTKTPQAQEETQKPDAGASGSAASDTGSSYGSDSGKTDADMKATGSIDSDKADGDAQSGSTMEQSGDTAEEQGSTDSGASATANVGGEFIGEQLQGEILASKLIGQPVVNANDEKIGDINDLLFSENNELTGVVIGVGGFLGIGEKSVAMSIDGLQFQQDADGNDMLVSSMSQAQLEEAPEFQTLDELELADTQAQQQAAAEREKAAPGMAPEPDSEPRAMDEEEPAPGQAPDTQNQ